MNLQKRIDRAKFLTQSILTRLEDPEHETSKQLMLQLLNELLNTLDGDFVNIVDVDVNIDDNTFFKIAEMAHIKDLTFNQIIELTLLKQIDDELNAESEEGEIS